MYLLFTQKLNQPPPRLVCYSVDLETAFAQLTFFEKNVVAPDVMFWIADENSLTDVIVPPCLN